MLDYVIALVVGAILAMIGFVAAVNTPKTKAYYWWRRPVRSIGTWYEDPILNLRLVLMHVLERVATWVAPGPASSVGSSYVDTLRYELELARGDLARARYLGDYRWQVRDRYAMKREAMLQDTIQGHLKELDRLKAELAHSARSCVRVYAKVSEDDDDTPF